MPVDNERPPYVKFEVRPVEDRAASETNGFYSTKDVDFVVIQRPGDRDTVEKEALQWLKEMKEKGRNGLIPPTWYPAYDAAYKAYKEDTELPLNGVPLKTWPVLAPSQINQLIGAGIRTVEDLANMPDGDLSRVIIGGISLKQKAVTWLESAKGLGTMVEKLTAAQTQINDLANTVQAQAAEITKLRAQLPEPQKATAK
jgi:hypothetical protein